MRSIRMRLYTHEYSSKTVYFSLEYTYFRDFVRLTDLDLNLLQIQIHCC